MTAKTIGVVSCALITVMSIIGAAALFVGHSIGECISGVLLVYLAVDIGRIGVEIAQGKRVFRG